MSSKKVPVRIGLKKKPASASANADSDISDLMSASTMEALEDIVVLDVEDVESALSDDEHEELPELEDEIERDLDPDYVPDAGPSSSRDPKGKRLINRPQQLPKRSLNLVNKDTESSQSSQSTSSQSQPTGKGRSTAPIWLYFHVSDKTVGGHIQKGAVCIVDISGNPCGKRIMQNGSSTTGLNQHLERRHPKEYAAYKKAQSTLQAERMSTKRTLVEHFEDLEGDKNIYFPVFFDNIIEKYR